MNQRVILITGANGGLGQAIARGFLQESPANIVWLGVNVRQDQAKALAQQNLERCRCLPLDVTSAEAWKEAVKKIVETDGCIDVLVNNAGRHEDVLLGTMPPSVWQGVLSVNLDSVFYGCQAVLPTMIRQRSGRIINISSLSALLAPAGQTNYAAAKAGVLALTQSMAKEVARIGITVNAICPGYIETEAVCEMDDARRKLVQTQIPMRRFGKPEEVAVAVVFLACERASYITGSMVKVDGGIL